MTRQKSFQHMQLEVLSYRARLFDEQIETLSRLNNGYKGELLFDEMLMQHHEIIHVKDLLFQYDGSREIQIDNIIIARDMCYIFEVKNFSFNLRIDAKGCFFYENGKECSMLNSQVERQKDSVRQLMNDIGYPMVIHHYLVFINPNQIMYGLESNHPIIMSNALNKFLEHNMKPNRKNYDFLESSINERRLLRSKHDQYYEINLDDMKKGVFCPNCNQRMRKVSRYRCQCGICLKYVGTVDAIKLLIRDIRCLNPEFKLDSIILSRLSNGEISSSAIRRLRLNGSVDF